MGKSAVYIDISKKNDPDNTFLAEVRSLFSDFEYVQNHKEMLEDYAKRVRSGKERSELVIVDSRGNEKCMNLCEALCRWIFKMDAMQRCMLIYDEKFSDRVASLNTLAIDYMVPFPLNELAHRRILKRLESDFGYSRSSSENETPSADIDRECIELYGEKLKTRSDFFKKKSEKIYEYMKNIEHLNQILAKSEMDEKSKGVLADLHHYSEMLKNVVMELEEFDRQYIQSVEEADSFDINILLDLVASAKEEAYRERGVELIYRVENSVPAKLTGRPALLKELLSESIETIVSRISNDELLINIFTSHGEGENLTLNFRFCTRSFDARELESRLDISKNDSFSKKLSNIGGRVLKAAEDDAHCIFELAVPTKIEERRSYRLPSKELMKTRILIASRKLDNAEALRVMLEYFHFYIVSADSDIGVKEAIKGNRFDLIFTDETLLDDSMAICAEYSCNAKVIALAEAGKVEEFSKKADVVLEMPFTQRKVFDTILRIYSKENLMSKTEILNVLKEYLHFLASGKKIVYVGKGFSEKMSIEILLEGSDVDFEAAERVSTAEDIVSRADLILVDIGDVVSDMNELESLLLLSQEEGFSQRLIGIVKNEELGKIDLSETIAIDSFLGKPLDPEKFYRLLLEKLESI